MMILKRASFLGLLLCLLAGCGGDAGDSTVQIWGARGALPGLFGSPRAIGYNRGFIYIIDRTGRVQKFNEQGDYVLDWKLAHPEKGTPTGIGFDAEGNVWIPDTHVAHILKYSTEGELLFSFGEYGEEAGRFIYPTDVDFNAEGDLFITEYGQKSRVQVFHPDGTYIRGWGEFGTGPEEFDRPMSILFGPGGLIYIADSVNHRIKVYEESGTMVRILGKEGSGPGEFLYPYDLAFDDEGRLLVCEWGNHRIQLIDVMGKSLGVWGGLGDAPGRFAEPWGVAWGAGRVFVADTKNHRIQSAPVNKVFPQ